MEPTKVKMKDGEGELFSQKKEKKNIYIYNIYIYNIYIYNIYIYISQLAAQNDFCLSQLCFQKKVKLLNCPKMSKRNSAEDF